MTVRSGLAASVAALAVVWGSACGGDDEPAGTMAATAAATVPEHLREPAEERPLPALPVSAGAGRPTKRFASEQFRPPFTLRLPPRWTAVERDEAAWQAWIGRDEERSPGELTFDSAMADVPVREAARRVRSSPGLGATPVRADRVAGRRALSFDARPRSAGELPVSRYRFAPGEWLRISVVEAGGATLAVIVTVQVPAARRAFLAQVAGVLGTVRFR